MHRKDQNFLYTPLNSIIKVTLKYFPLKQAAKRSWKIFESEKISILVNNLERKNHEDLVWFIFLSERRMRISSFEFSAFSTYFIQRKLQKLEETDISMYIPYRFQHELEQKKFDIKIWLNIPPNWSTCHIQDVRNSIRGMKNFKLIYLDFSKWYAVYTIIYTQMSQLFPFHFHLYFLQLKLNANMFDVSKWSF